MLDKKASFEAPLHERVSFLAIKAAKWAVALAVFRQILTIVTTMVVSRHVTPEEFGIAAMVLSFVAFLVLFDTGLTWATVQSPSLDQNKIDSLFAIGTILGICLWLVAILCGPYISIFYSQPALASICNVMGAAVFLNSLTTQPAALLKRQLKQKITNIIDTVALIASSVIAVILSLKGQGYWAVIGQAVSLQIFRTLLLFLFSGYRPSIPNNLFSAYPELRIGFGLAVSNYVCYFQLYLGGLIIGKYFGGAVLGNYQKAYSIKSMPTGYAVMVITDVMVSSLSALRSDQKRMGAAYQKVLCLLAFIACPAGALLYAVAPEVVHILYGKQWQDAVPLLEWFAIAAVALPISTTTIWLFLASGQIRLQLIMNVVLSLIAVVSLILATIKIGTVEAVVATEAILFAGPFLLINILVSHHATGLNALASLKLLVPIILGSIVSTAAAVFIGGKLLEFNWYILFIIKIITCISIYLLFSVFFNRSILIDIFKRLFK